MWTGLVVFSWLRSRVSSLGKPECAEDGEPCSPTRKPPFCTLLISSKAAFHPHSPSHPSCSLYLFSWLKLCQQCPSPPRYLSSFRLCSKEIPPLTQSEHCSATQHRAWSWAEEIKKPLPPFLCMSHHHSQVSSPRMPARLLILEDLSLFLSLF